MVSISGVDIKFGRILIVIAVIGVLIFAYKRFGSGSKELKALDSSSTSTLLLALNPKSAPSADQQLQNIVALNPKPAPSDKQQQNSEQVENLSPPVTLNLKLISLDVTLDKAKKCTTTYIEVKPDTSDLAKPSILLLHGAKYTSLTWDTEIKTMSQLKNWGYRAVALDLKDKSIDANCTGGKDEGRAAFIHQVVKDLSLDKVVLVSPSKSGEFSIPYILDSERSKGLLAYIPIAPMFSVQEPEKFVEVKVKTLIVLGSEDSYIPDLLTLLEKIPGFKKEIIPDAGHACYRDKPAEWHNILHSFLTSLTLPA